MTKEWVWVIIWVIWTIWVTWVLWVEHNNKVDLEICKVACHNQMHIALSKDSNDI